MIGIIPILFLIYFSVIIYNEKSQNVKLIGNYIEQLNQSANLGELIDALAREQKYRFQYVLKKADLDQVIVHRRKTDSIINVLKKSSDISLSRFAKNPFLQNLHEIRLRIDTSKGFLSNDLMEYYTETILRLNSLKSNVPINSFLMPVYQDLITLRTLSEMITYLGVIRTSLFKSLYTKKNDQEMIMNIAGLYKTYHNYETEFLLTASSSSLGVYSNEKKSSDYGAVTAYLKKLSSTLKLDSAYSASEWWRACSNSMKVLKKQKADLSKSVNARIQEIYQHEKNIKNSTIIFLLLSVLFVIAFVSYTINEITKLLRELKLAARKISKGATGIDLKNMPRGVIGTLAKSITRIETNNLLMAQAASEIGKGNFDVTITPRSEEDILGISIKKMQHDLREFTAQKDKIQKETEDLIYKRDEFFSVASHELKTPVTSLKAYNQLLLMDATTAGDEQNLKMLAKMDDQIGKLTSLINDLLDTSRLQSGTLVYHREDFQLKQLVAESIDKIKQTAEDYEFIFKPDSNGYINADRERIAQVVINFLSNAVKYGGDSKKIIIELKQTDSKIVCSVEDFGKGIVPDEQDKIFGRFYRISGKYLNTFPGLGLGLFISKEIIENQEGTIGVISEKGKGSIFYFELPLVDTYA